MKKQLLLCTAVCLSLSVPALAQTNMPDQRQASIAQSEAADPVMIGISKLQERWAQIKYQVAGKDSKLEALHDLEKRAKALTLQNPQRAEPQIWQAIILSTDAGIDGGLSALSKVKTARKLLESALAISPQALDGSAYTSLGSLYYQVPGWPIGFGNDDQAKKYLHEALRINPGGIDPNYFYGDFLIEQERYDEAERYLRQALQASPRPGRALADAGRRQEVQAALAQLKEKGKNKARKQYN